VRATAVSVPEAILEVLLLVALPGRSIAIENSPKLITPKSVHGNILPGSQSQLESVQGVSAFNDSTGLDSRRQDLVRSFLRSKNVPQRVDIYAAQKTSYEVLRRESSPVESLNAENTLNAFQLRLRTRQDVPMYTLRVISLGEFSMAMETSR